jgi:ATP-dependent HslUV protease ATP-binding subunit HslU
VNPSEVFSVADESMTPRQIVAELDKYIVGQGAAKKAVAVAIRNRWRRQQLPAELRQDVTPKNIILIGPTGVGKTEIARRLASLVGAPFIKVEATKFTEVGYVGRDVESIIRDLTEAGIGLVRAEMRVTVQEKAKERVTERLLDLLVPAPKNNSPWEPEQENEEQDRRQRTRDKMKAKLDAGELEDRMVELTVEQKSTPVQIFSNLGMENMDVDLQGMFDKMMPKSTQPRQLPVKEARKVLLEQETESLIDRAAVVEQAVERVENHGIVFLDEIDKVCGSSASQYGPDVSRQGVQRDLLPVVEGTTVNTKHGPVKTDHILFIAAGAFHISKPADLMPELQGRFPIRVELTDLTKADFLRVLMEPKHALPKQYGELLRTEGVELEFTRDGLEAIADIAFEVNRMNQNIGARRLHTVIEKVVEEISFDGPDLPDKRVVIDGKFVREKLGAIAQREDLSRFIL